MCEKSLAMIGLIGSKKNIRTNSFEVGEKMEIKHAWYKDYYRFTDDDEFEVVHFIRDYVTNQGVRFIYYLRKAQFAKNPISKVYYEFKLYRLKRKFGLEINTKTKIGEGLLLSYPYNITVNSGAVIGRNVNLKKGVTIGNSAGKHSGNPVIGDYVQVGINSTVIGNISIGDDVLIAPNTLVNIDVPSHSVVIGCPCKIFPKENATIHYVYHTV